MPLRPNQRLTRWLVSHGFRHEFRRSFRRIPATGHHVWVHLTTSRTGYVESTRFHLPLWFTDLIELEIAVIYESLREDWSEDLR